MRPALFAICYAAIASAQPASDWTIYVTNDSCSDYTWGLTEGQTRRAFADIVRAHLDEMRRTDEEKPESRDRYNLSVTQEALCFLEHYPERKNELIQRVKQGRAYVSPFLNNSLWGFQSSESLIRTLSPARRMEREWGLPMDVAEHIEEPSLPWGAASILAACGVRWVSVPFYDYDSTFKGLTNPPAFQFEGPDGQRIRVVMDPWASTKWNYVQGGKILENPKLILSDWLPHYRSLGASYPARAILASGTHGDISPGSGAKARTFSDKIAEYNSQPGPHPTLVNATLPQFCRAMDEAESHTPFLPTLRGCFGHSWDVWPVSLAKYAAAMRETERRFIAAEALLALSDDTALAAATRAGRERAEWNWTMLADHTWNGTDDANKRVNSELRRTWSADFARLTEQIADQGWAALGLDRSARAVTVFNSLSVPRADLVRMEAPAGLRIPNSQRVIEAGVTALYFVSPAIDGFSLAPVHQGRSAAPLRANAVELESPFYRARLNPAAGGISSLIYKPSGAELAPRGSRYAIGETAYFDGREHGLSDVKVEVAAAGPVLARWKVSGRIAGIGVTTYITVYAAIDRVDFDYHIDKPVRAQMERLCHMFPVAGPNAAVRIETTGAVIRPRPQPEGDLLAGADVSRFAVQGFVDASAPGGPGVTVAPLDAFALRQDLAPFAFEALGNDQNYKEVSRDQGGVREFRFRYSLRAHAGGYNQAEAVAWSRAVATPPIAVAGAVRNAPAGSIRVDAARAIATALKPADDGVGTILRVWEVGGGSEPVAIGLRGFSRAIRTDLLERDVQHLPVSNGTVMVPVKPYGFAAVRLER